MRRITFVFVVVGLLVSALSVSAQQTRPRQRTQSDSRQQAVVVPMGQATLPVVRMDRSWRRPGAGTFGGGYGRGYYGTSWRGFGQQALVAGIAGVAMGLAMRQQNPVVEVVQPEYQQQAIPMVYQPPSPPQVVYGPPGSAPYGTRAILPPPPQTCDGTHEWVENASADRMYVVIADGDGKTVWGNWVFNHQKLCAPYVERGWTITGSYDARMVQNEHTVGTTTDCRINLNPVPGFGWRSASRCDSSQVREN